MSHFTVLVIGNDVEEQLAPFQENNMGDCPQKYLSFEIEVELGKEKAYQDEELSGEYINKPDKKVDLAKYKAMTPEKFIEEWAGYEKGEGGYGYWTNLDSKWDWYQIGGRWAGMLKVKNGTVVDNPNFSWGWDKKAKDKKLKGRHTDQATKREIDFAGMIKDCENRAKIEWEKLEALFTDGIPQIERSWEKFLDDKRYKDINTKRKAYHAQSSEVLFKEIMQKNRKKNDAFIWYNLNDFQGTKEDYIKFAGESAIETFAVLNKGEWNEKGSIGWWGCSSKTDKEAEKWRKGFYEAWIKDLSDDTLLTIVDCHI